MTRTYARRTNMVSIYIVNTQKARSESTLTLDFLFWQAVHAELISVRFGLQRGCLGNSVRCN